MDQVRFLVVGVGGMGRAHIGNLLACEEVVIAGLVEPVEAAILAAKNAYPQIADTPVYKDLATALAEAHADASVIVTPHSLHLEQAMACLDAGVDVLMEKPFVAGSDNARALIERARVTGRKLAVAYQRHTQGVYRYMHDLVHQGELGTVVFVCAYQAQAWQQGTVGTWRQDPELSCGGQLNDSGSHLIDAVLWIVGQPVCEVSAAIDNRGTRVDIDSALTLRFTNGAVANISVVGSASIGWWEDVSIHGTMGTALYRNGKLYVARSGEGHPSEVNESEFAQASDPDRDFVDWLLGRVSAAAAPAEAGLAVAELTEAAWKSAAQGMPVIVG